MIGILVVLAYPESKSTVIAISIMILITVFIVSLEDNRRIYSKIGTESIIFNTILGNKDFSETIIHHFKSKGRNINFYRHNYRYIPFFMYIIYTTIIVSPILIEITLFLLAIPMVLILLLELDFHRVFRRNNDLIINTAYAQIQLSPYTQGHIHAKTKRNELSLNFFALFNTSFLDYNLYILDSIRFVKNRVAPFKFILLVIILPIFNALILDKYLPQFSILIFVLAYSIHFIGMLLSGIILVLLTKWLVKKEVKTRLTTVIDEIQGDEFLQQWNSIISGLPDLPLEGRLTDFLNNEQSIFHLKKQLLLVFMQSNEEMEKGVHSRLSKQKQRLEVEKMDVSCVEIDSKIIHQLDFMANQYERYKLTRNKSLATNDYLPNLLSEFDSRSEPGNDPVIKQTFSRPGLASLSVEEREKLDAYCSSLWNIVPEETDPRAANEYNVHANKQIRYGNYLSAFESYDKALQYNPRNVTVLLNKANLLIDFEYYLRAFELLEQGLTLDPNNSLIARRRSWLLGVCKTKEVSLLSPFLVDLLIKKHYKISLKDIATRLLSTDKDVRNLINTIDLEDHIQVGDTHIINSFKRDKEKYSGEECVICRSGMYTEDNPKIICLYCENQYHYNELREWLRTNQTCPICKESINLEDYK
ncbi:MAG: hypothetical protein INQ03_03495 [Candidatus Heimdallarchaeota archaeon]|nr:hypothetical protein [Candidatus Heimdallarchaeota archaeon]